MPRRVNTAKIGVDARSEYWSKWHNSLSDAIESLDRKTQEEAEQNQIITKPVIEMPRRINTANIGVDSRSEYWSKWHNSLSDTIESLDRKTQEEAKQTVERGRTDRESHMKETEERDRKDREANMKAEIAMLVYQIKSNQKF